MEILGQILLMLMNSGLALVVGYATYKFKKKEAKRDKQREEEKARQEHEQARRETEEKEQRIKLCAINEGIISLLRDAIYNLCKQAESDGYITVKETEQLTDLYQVYHQIGGNHAIEAVVFKVMKLPNKIE